MLIFVHGIMGVQARPKDKSKSRGLGITPLPPRPPKKDFDEGEFIQVDLDESLFSG